MKRMQTHTHTHARTRLPQGWGCQDTLPGPDEAAGYGSGRSEPVCPNISSACPCFLSSDWWDWEKTGTDAEKFSWVAVKLGGPGSSYSAKMGLDWARAKTEPGPTLSLPPCVIHTLVYSLRLSSFLSLSLSLTHINIQFTLLYVWAPLLISFIIYQQPPQYIPYLHCSLS